MRDTDLVICIFLFAIFGMLCLAIRRRRQAIRHNLRMVLLSAAAGIVGFAIAQSIGIRGDAILLVGIISAVIVAGTFGPRSRHIPKKVRRSVVAKWEEESGERFDRRKHEIDHDVPFSRGGSHSEDNLRVRTKEANRKKGAKSPWWDLLGN